MTGVGTTSTRARTISSMEGVVAGCFIEVLVVATRSAPAHVAGAHQAALNRVEGSLGSALQLELSQDVAHVCLYRLLADMELAGHLLVCLAFRQEPKDGGFPLGQDLGASRNLHLAHESRRGLRRQMDLARGRPPGRLPPVVRPR